ncbi:hypothetical protein IKG24_01695 [Candidatus Saccharibacteria bacterium]|nr:hypothetical protein [Candidatus Saccharibacteria bacterium]
MQQSTTVKTSKLNTFLKIFLCLDLIAIIGLGIAIIVKNTKGGSDTGLNGELVYEYRENSIPGGEYKVNLNYATGYVQVTETRFCSAVDCHSTTNEYSGTLDIDELKKIQTITSKDYDIDHLTKAITSLIEGGNLAVKSEHEEYWLENYAEDDLNQDGVVTNKEFGTKWLDYMLEEQ